VGAVGFEPTTLAL